MESSVKITTEVNFKLNKKEALWLKGIMQNPINCDYEKEDKKDQIMRDAFWNSLISVKS